MNKPKQYWRDRIRLLKNERNLALSNGEALKVMRLDLRINGIKTREGIEDE